MEDSKLTQQYKEIQNSIAELEKSSKISGFIDKDFVSKLSNYINYGNESIGGSAFYKYMHSETEEVSEELKAIQKKYSELYKKYVEESMKLFEIFKKYIFLNSQDAKQNNDDICRQEYIKLIKNTEKYFQQEKFINFNNIEQYKQNCNLIIDYQKKLLLSFHDEINKIEKHFETICDIFRIYSGGPAIRAYLHWLYHKHTKEDKEKYEQDTAKSIIRAYKIMLKLYGDNFFYDRSKFKNEKKIDDNEYFIDLVSNISNQNKFANLFYHYMIQINKTLSNNSYGHEDKIHFIIDYQKETPWVRDLEKNYYNHNELAELKKFNNVLYNTLLDTFKDETAVHSFCHNHIEYFTLDEANNRFMCIDCNTKRLFDIYNFFKHLNIDEYKPKDELEKQQINTLKQLFNDKNFEKDEKKEDKIMTHVILPLIKEMYNQIFNIQKYNENYPSYHPLLTHYIIYDTKDNNLLSKFFNDPIETIQDLLQKNPGELQSYDTSITHNNIDKYKHNFIIKDIDSISDDDEMNDFEKTSSIRDIKDDKNKANNSALLLNPNDTIKNKINDIKNKTQIISSSSTEKKLSMNKQNNDNKDNENLAKSTIIKEAYITHINNDNIKAKNFEQKDIDKKENQKNAEHKKESSINDKQSEQNINNDENINNEEQKNIINIKNNDSNAQHKNQEEAQENKNNSNIQSKNNINNTTNYYENKDNNTVLEDNEEQTNNFKTIIKDDKNKVNHSAYLLNPSETIKNEINDMKNKTQIISSSTDKKLSINDNKDNNTVLDDNEEKQDDFDDISIIKDDDKPNIDGIEDISVIENENNDNQDDKNEEISFVEEMNALLEEKNNTTLNHNDSNNSATLHHENNNLLHKFFKEVHSQIVNEIVEKLNNEQSTNNNKDQNDNQKDTNNDITETNNNQTQLNNTKQQIMNNEENKNINTNKENVEENQESSQIKNQQKQNNNENGNATDTELNSQDNTENKPIKQTIVVAPIERYYMEKNQTKPTSKQQNKKNTSNTQQKSKTLPKSEKNNIESQDDQQKEKKQKLLLKLFTRPYKEVINQSQNNETKSNNNKTNNNIKMNNIKITNLSNIIPNFINIEQLNLSETQTDQLTEQIKNELGEKPKHNNYEYALMLLLVGIFIYYFKEKKIKKYESKCQQIIKDFIQTPDNQKTDFLLQHSENIKKQNTQHVKNNQQPQLNSDTINNAKENYNIISIN